MSYNSRDLDTLATQFLNGNFSKSELEQKILEMNYQGDDYIVDSQKAQKNRTRNSYRIENQGDHLVMLDKNEEPVAVLEYYLDFDTNLAYITWGEFFKPGKGCMGILFSEIKKVAEKEGIQTIACEIDEINERMQEIAYHWGFEKGNRVHNSKNTESYFYYYRPKLKNADTRNRTWMPERALGSNQVEYHSPHVGLRYLEKTYIKNVC